MSARRQARARDIDGAVTDNGGIPRPLLVGPCIEVWDSQSVPGDALTARRRFRDTRHWWLISAGFPDPGSTDVLPPTGAPWSVEYLSYHGQATRVGRPVAEIVTERLARAGCNVVDIPDLALEASRLYQLAQKGALTQRTEHAHERDRHPD